MDLLLEHFTGIYANELDDFYVKNSIESVLDTFREKVKTNVITNFEYEDVIKAIDTKLQALLVGTFKPVINATGIVLHTNLGRAVLPVETMAAIEPILTGYNTLEYDLESGRRGSRYAHVESKIKMLTGAEAALVVNNNAAACMLVLSTLAKGKEVLVSRGELVEIGGAFRVPDVMSASGCLLKEVGTTNKTHLYDYENGIGENTALLMKVHTSNYRIVGFTKTVEAEELKSISTAWKIPIYEDLGSGLMLETDIFPEPIVSEKIASGIDVLSFSGDKLFGGAQCGIIIGKKALIEPMKKNPLLRAFRMDKMTLAVLDHCLRLYLKPDKAIRTIPTLRDLLATEEAIVGKVERFKTLYSDRLSKLDCHVECVALHSEVGGGALPDEQLPSRGLKLSNILKLSAVQYQMRLQEMPIVAMVSNDSLYLDFRTIFERDFEQLMRGLENSIGKEGGHA